MEQSKITSSLAVFAEVVVISEFLALHLDTLNVEPFLAFSALDVFEVSIDWHFADAFSGPLAGVRQQSQGFLIETGSSKVDVLGSASQFFVLLVGENVALVLDGLHVDELRVSRRKDLGN